MAESIAQADVIVIGVPTLSLEPTLQLVKEHARKETIITDVASVKGSVVEAALQVYGDVPARFVPGHPIAGSEKSGVAGNKSSRRVWRWKSRFGPRILAPKARIPKRLH